jgi:hypothetical protein
MLMQKIGVYIAPFQLNPLSIQLNAFSKIREHKLKSASHVAFE